MPAPRRTAARRWLLPRRSPWGRRGGGSAGGPAIRDCAPLGDDRRGVRAGAQEFLYALRRRDHPGHSEIIFPASYYCGTAITTSRTVGCGTSRPVAQTEFTLEGQGRG